jgi:serine/threonine-protein kinase
LHPEGGIQIFIRQIDRLEPRALAGTKNGRSPFFSPDGRWIGFFADAKLKRVSVDGGAIVALADAPQPRGGAWGQDGTVVFAPGAGAGLARVPAGGGKAEALTVLDKSEIAVGWPQLVRGGRAVLFTSYLRPRSEDNSNMVLQTLPTGPRRTFSKWCKQFGERCARPGWIAPDTRRRC